MPDPGMAEYLDAMRQSGGEDVEILDRHLGSYDKKGKPITLAETLVIDTPEYRRVAQTTFVDGTFVSTIWIGSDPGFESRRQGRPRVFETKILHADEWQSMGDRYCSELEAAQGHCRMLDEVIKRLRDPSIAWTS